jgi:hypothetical protein
VHLLRASAALLATVALALPAAATAGSSASSQRSFVGTDGNAYPSAPQTVVGRNGELYYGPDFDIACGLGSRTSRTMHQIGELARVIERSGRTVLWAVAPNKTTVRPENLPDPLPHGACDARGLADTGRVLERIRDRNFLPLRAKLAGYRRQTYFQTDTHWTTVGGSLFARAVARRLDPRVAALQSYEYGTEQRIGILNYFIGNMVLETAATAMPTTKVHSTTAPTSADQQWSGYPQVTYDYSWDTRPGKRTIPGRTVVLGDSFSMFALDNLMPLFRHGRFLWRGNLDEDVEFRAVRRADTVVIEVAEVLAPLGSPVADPGYRRRLEHYLR